MLPLENRSTISSKLVQPEPKASGPCSVTYLDWTPLQECCVSRCGFKNGHQKEVGLCAQITLSNSRFDSQHHNLWDTYVII